MGYGERDDVRAILKRNAGKRYEDIPKHFRDKIESHYAIKHVQSYYQKKAIKVDQKKCQAAVPKVVENFPGEPPTKQECFTEVWNPTLISEPDLEQYLTKAKEYLGRASNQENICPEHHKTPQIKLAHSMEEVALKVLHLCNYSVKKALYCLVAKCDLFWYDITKQMTDDARQYNIHSLELP